MINAFEKTYNVKVRDSNFDSMQGMMAKLRSGNRYDIIFPSSEWADRLIKANQLLRIDQEQLSNLGSQLYAPFRNPWYDPSAKYTVPYALYAPGRPRIASPPSRCRACGCASATTSPYAT